MPSNPSRSEIESALLRPKQPLRDAERADSYARVGELAPRRKRNVIGGDLAGVAHRRARAKFARLTGFELANWAAIATVLLILVAFFWPTGKRATIKEVQSPTSSVQSAPFYSESRVDVQSTAQPQNQNFGRTDDIARADRYRIQDEMAKRVRQLLALAEQQMARNEYTLPTGNNASQTYRQVLLLSPNNADALAGLEFIRNRFLGRGQAALSDNNLSAANAALSKIASIDQNSEEHAELATAIEGWQRSQRITALLAKAESAFDENKLVLPARDNALYYYQQVLDLQKSNSVATAGIKNIADDLVNRTALALREGEVETAASYLTTVSVIDSEHPSLALMQAQLQRAQSTIAKATSEPAPTDNPSSLQTESPTAPLPAPVSRQSREQAEIDRQFLRQGLDAYYKGDYSSAAALLQPLADRGVSRAQLRLGYMHFLGRGFTADRNEADRIIRAALPAVQKFAEEGRSWAQSDIGSLYEDGLVVPRDYRKAVDWYRRAADQGYPGAQTNLGLMYARGRGVSSSRRTAIEWFQRAAKQGDIVARRNLEAMGIDQ